MKKDEDKAEPASGKNPLEWAVFAAAAAVVLAVAGLLGLEALQWEGRPARLQIEPGTPTVEDGLLYQPVKVSNRGDTVAINVAVRVTARSAEGDRSVDLRFDFIPRGASREGRATFPPDQDPGQIEARVAGYEVP